MKSTVAPTPSAAEVGIDERILRAAFAAFAEVGFDAASTLDIAKRARVSKRDLYARFGSKQAMLVACIKNRTERMGLSRSFPAPRNREQFGATLSAFAAALLRQVSDGSVIAAFRLAIAEATRSPEIAQTLDLAGRASTRKTLAALFAAAQVAGLIGSGDPTEMATQYLGLLWEGLMLGLLLAVEAIPSPVEAEQRSARATAAFMRLHSSPAANR